MKAVKTTVNIFLGGVAGLLIAGCNVGVTPAGASGADFKAAFDKLPLEDRVKTIMSSPMPYADKVQKVKEMYAKEGKTPPADLGGGGGTPGSVQH